MAIIYSYPLNDDIKSLDELVGTTEKNINGQLKTVTRNFLLSDLAEFFIVDGGLQKTITLTTDGSSGVSTLDQVTGVLNIPDYSGVIPPAPSLQLVTDVGAITTNTMTVDSTNYYSLLQPQAIGTENKITGSYAFLGGDGVVGISNGMAESEIKNTNVTNNNIVLEFPDKPTGSYTIATTLDITTPSLQSVLDYNHDLIDGKNFQGTAAGYEATNASHSNFLGANAGGLAIYASNSNFLGQDAGYNATNASDSNFIGSSAGYQATNAMHSNFIGSTAGINATVASNSNFIGTGAGSGATNANDSNFLGTISGANATDALQSNFIGISTGESATNANNSNFFGSYAGYEATNASDSNFLGHSTGGSATNAYQSNFIGIGTGNGATNANNSNFLGYQAGHGAINASHSNLLGYQVGFNFTDNNIGSNNIIIGTNISLPDATTNSLNIGGVLFGTGTYSTTEGDPSIVPTSGGKIGIGVVEPTNTLHIYSEAEDTSGLRLERLTSASPTTAGQAIGVDASGNVVTVEGGGGGSQDLQSVLDIGSTAYNTNVLLSSEGGDTLTVQGEGIGLGTLVAYSGEETGIAIRAINQNNGTAIRADGRVTALGGLGLALYAESFDGGEETDKNVDVASFVNNTLREEELLYDCSAINVNTIDADGIRVYTSAGNGAIINLGLNAYGITVNSGASSLGNPITIIKNGVNKLVVNQAGELTATKLIKQGGLSTEFLKADGSVSTAPTNLTTSQTASNFTINSDTGTDASVPLGDGTLAGATLNNYTTTEKNKLAAITGTNTGDQNLQQVTDLGASTTNPITANSFVKSGGTSSQILAADGSVITAGNNITITGGQISSVGGAGGGGSSVNYYLNGGTSQGTFGGSTYYEFSKTAVVGTGVDFNRGTNGYIASFITDVADPSLLLIPGGNWNLEFYFSSSSAGGSPSFYVELYKYDGTTFTSIASSSATPEGITNGTSIDAYFTALAVPETVLTVNDRLAIRVFVNASSKTITLHTQDSHLCQVITTFTTGLTALNGLQAQVQNFATGTTGTDFDIVSSGSTHTFNLPSASATARGVVTTGTQTFAGAKTFSSTIKIPPNPTNSGAGAILIDTDGLGTVVPASNLTYPNLTELTYVKGVSSSIQTQFTGKVSTNTAITGATNTKITYDSKGLVTAGTSLIASDIPNISQLQVTNLTSDLGLKQNKSLSAYSMVANNTASTASATEFTFRKWDLATYGGTIAWVGTTAPTTITAQSYSGQQVGNMVSINLSVVYTTAGAGDTQVTLTLPSDFPTPVSPTGFTTALDVIAYGTGQIMANTAQTVATGARGCFLRRNAANNGYEFFLNVSIATAARVVMLNLTYQTS